MSQMPEVAGGWPEEGSQYVPGAPMEPGQQGYPPQAPYQHQQQYQPQGYPEQQYPQPQQQYPPQQQYQENTVPQQMVFEEEQASVPSEFDHLFRDSAPQERRSISGRQPMVSGPGAAPSPGFQQQAQAQQQAPQAQATQVVPQQQQATAMFDAQQQYQQAPMQGYAAGQTQQTGGPFGYDGPGGPGSGGSGSGNRRTPLIIGGVVVVIAAVGLYFGLSGGTSAKTPTAKSSTTAVASSNSNETAQQQADAVYALVKQAGTLRDDISNAVGQLKACDISSATTEINATATARAAAAAKVATLPVSKISGGSSVVSALQAAWQDSATSDQDYAKAAADFASGSCSEKKVEDDANYQAAVGGSGTSESAKNNAATVWNQVMANYESKVSPTDL